jgi:cytochrome P450
VPTNVIIDLAELARSEGADLTTDPYRAYARLRQEGPIHRVRLPNGDESWLVVEYEEAKSVLVDPRFTSDPSRSATWEDDGSLSVGRNMMQVDDASHARLRKLVAATFTARRVKDLEPRVREVTDELLDAFPAKGRVDLVDGFAMPLAMSVICELMGVSRDDIADFHGWSRTIIKPESPEAVGAAMGAMTAYFGKLIGQKQAGPGDDLLSALVRANQAGDAISDEELFGMVFLLFVAGHETTVDLISNAVLALLRHPDQLAALRADWSLLDNVIEETLRHSAPVQSSAYRFNKEPVTIAGVDLPAGESVLVSLASAGRSPDQFTDADRFDIHRPPAETKAHMAFGKGVHHCVGAPLARMEAAIALRTFLERYPKIRLAGEVTEEVAWRPNAMLRGPGELPLTLG